MWHKKLFFVCARNVIRFTTPRFQWSNYVLVVKARPAVGGFCTKTHKG